MQESEKWGVSKETISPSSIYELCKRVSKYEFSVCFFIANGFNDNRAQGVSYEMPRIVTILWALKI